MTELEPGDLFVNKVGSLCVSAWIDKLDDTSYSLRVSVKTSKFRIATLDADRQDDELRLRARDL